jgi:hypothetical protein
MTSAMVRCSQPGYAGTIQDGYCDTCGLAPAAAAAGSTGSGASGPSGPSGSASSAQSSGSSPSTRSRAGAPIVGCEPDARAVRFGLERSYRALARLTPDASRRIELVDMANAIRPRTLT